MDRRQPSGIIARETLVARQGIRVNFHVMTQGAKPGYAALECSLVAHCT
jgi:hypothetical protein